jgi:TRAP-type uncharacterized transport system substrate-binding protein
MPWYVSWRSLVSATVAAWSAIAILGAYRAEAQDAQDLYSLGIVTNQADTSEFAVANDLATVFMDAQETGPKGQAIRLLPVVGTGGVGAVRDLLKLRGIDFALVSIPVMDHLRETQELGPLDKIWFVSRVPDREMHILAAPEIGRMADLEGKRVNLGALDSDTSLVARTMFRAIGLEVIETNLPYADALEALRSGNLAATVMLSSRPIPALQRLSRTPGFHFVEVDAPGYSPATLGAEDYPGLIGSDEHIRTVSIPSGLWAIQRPPGSARAALMDHFVETILTRQDYLRRPPRHPRWRDLDLRADLPGWPRHPAAVGWLRRNPAATSAVGATMPEPERDLRDQYQLFEEFLRWRERKR